MRERRSALLRRGIDRRQRCTREASKAVADEIGKPERV
jgi:hypothetical protein